MKRHWPMLVVVLLAVAGSRRAASLAAHRNEYQLLREELAAVDRVSDRNSNSAPPVTAMAPDAVRVLREDAFRVHQLRGEVTLAQQRLDNLAPVVANLAARLSARTNQLNTPALPEFPPDYRPRHDLADRGNATPEAALETFWWAMSRGNGTRLYSVMAELIGQNLPHDATNADAGFLALFRTFPGYRIVRRESRSANQMVLGLETAPGAKVVDMRLIFVNGQWYVSGESLNTGFGF